MTSQPCKNGASCLPLEPKPSIHTKRFTCKCPPGYQGDYCELPMRSCLDYYVNQTKDGDGIYYVINSKNKTFPVFCKFTTLLTKVRWVHNLILSYKWYNSFSQLLMNGVNEDNPTVTPYRLSSPEMENIRKHFQRWRIKFATTQPKNCRSTVDVDFDHQKKECQSCYVRIHERVNDRDKVILSSTKCNFTNIRNSNCEGLGLNFGLYCCIDINLISHYCPPKSGTKVRTWFLQSFN